MGDDNEEKQRTPSRPNHFTRRRFLGGLAVASGIVACMALVAIASVIGGIMQYTLWQLPPRVVAAMEPTPTSAPAPAAGAESNRQPTDASDVSVETHGESTGESAAPTVTLVPTATPIPEPEPVGTLRVDHWRWEITAVYADPGRDASRQSVVLLGDLTNESASADSFSGLFAVELQDTRGRRYTEFAQASWAAQRKYGAEMAVEVAPGETVLYALAFDAPATETTFTIVSGTMVSGWSGDIDFALP